MAAAELGAALGLSPGSAMRRVSQATELQRLPQTRLALARGDLDPAKARMVLEMLRPLDDEAAARVDAAVVAGAAGRTYRQLRDSLRRAVIAVDPDAAKKRVKQVAADRTVERFDTSNGGAGVTWLDDPVAIERFYTWLTATAEAARGPGDTRTLDQRRADVLADLGRRGLDEDTTHPDLPTEPTPTEPAAAPPAPRRGRVAPRRLPTRQGRRPQIQVVVSIETLLGLDDMPGELVGFGPITADTARRIAGEGTWRLLTDPGPAASMSCPSTPTTRRRTWSTTCSPATDTAGADSAAGCPPRGATSTTEWPFREARRRQTTSIRVADEITTSRPSPTPRSGVIPTVSPETCA